MKKVFWLKFSLPVLVIFFMLFLLLFFQSYKKKKDWVENRLSFYQGELKTVFKDQLKEKTQIVVSALSAFAENLKTEGKSFEEIEKLSADYLKQFHYGGSGYFWAVGRDRKVKLQSFWGNQAIPSQKEILTLIKNTLNSGEDYQEYLYPREKNGEPRLKIAYARMVFSLQWVVGSGFYPDDFSEQLNHYRKKLEQDLSSQLKQDFLFYGAAFFGLLAFFWLISRHWMKKNLDIPLNRIQHILNHNESAEIKKMPNVFENLSALAKESEQQKEDLLILKKRLEEKNLEMEILLKSLDDVVLELDEQGHLLHLWSANDRAGFFMEDSLGGHYSEIYQGQFSFLSQEQIEKVFATGWPVYEEYETFLQGRIHWCGAKYSLIPAVGGRPKISILLRDITEIHKAQELLEESRNRYRAIFEGTSEGILIAEKNSGKMIYANPAVCRLFGYALDEWNQLSFLQIHPENFRSEAVKSFENTQSSPSGNLVSSVPCLKKSGEIFFADIKDAQILIDGKECKIAFFTDVTQRAASLKLIDKLAENLPGMIYQYRLRPDGTSHFPFSSKGILQIYGVTPKEVQESAESVFDVIHPADLTRVIKVIQESARELKVWRDEYRVLTREGHYQWVEGYATPEKELDGAILWHGYITRIHERKKMELEKKALAAIIEKSDDLAVIKDLSLRVMAANSAYLAITRFNSLEEIIGKTHGDLFSESGEEVVKQYVQDELETQNLEPGQVRVSEMTIIFKGEEKTVLTRRFPVYDDSNKLIATAFVATDITERKASEERLRQSEEKFRHMFFGHSAVMMLIDADTGKIIEANHSSETFYGYSIAELTQKTIQEINMLSAEEVFSEMQCALKQKRNFFIFKHRLKDGEVREVEVHSSPMVLENKKILFSIVFDITERALLENSLRESEEKFRQLAENIHQVFWLQSQTQLLYLSPAYEAIWQRSRTEAEENTHFMLDYMHSEDWSRFLQIYGNERSLVLGVFDEEFRILLPDGNIRWIRARTFPIKDSDGKTEKVAGIAEDISERKNLEAALKNYNLFLEQELSEKKRSLLNAQQIQRGLNPRFLPVHPYLDMAAFYLPSEELGGDFFHVLPMQDRVGVILGDCEGHGLEASLDSVLAKSICDRYLNVLEIDRTDIFLETVNRDIIRYFKSEKFLTLLVAVFHVDTGNVFYSSANAETPLLIRKGQIEPLPRAEGWHIGFDAKAQYERKTFQMEEGDSLLFASDALRESISPGGEVFGMKRIEAMGNDLGFGTRQDLNKIREILKDFVQPMSLKDDLTLCILQMQGSFYQESEISGLSDLSKVKTRIQEILKQRNYEENVYERFEKEQQDFLKGISEIKFEIKIFINFKECQISVIRENQSLWVFEHEKSSGETIFSDQL